MSTIVKVAIRDEWDAAQSTGSYVTGSLESEGFIHCSPPEEVAGVANYHYAGHTDLLLLYIDTERVASEIRYDHGDDVWWPHIHGVLNLDAVDKVVDFPPDEDGSFSQP